MLHKILIANRGEIAVRILTACREMGVATVAVYSEADAHALHTTLADEAVCIGPPPPADSYLAGSVLIDAARRTGCDAIHPGYGFLSENADFAAAVVDADLVWIGPPPDVMARMGDKRSARAAMKAAGVPTVPGYQSSDADEDLLAAAATIGFPLLVKATAGGGGKGMRAVQSAAELPAALASARREASHAFGNDRLYLEQLLPEPRHVEIQVLGDHHGHVVHLFERECSIQRRHQKIVEETPSPLLDDELRRQMGESAANAARALGYVNAGTLEFLVDADRKVYFLEMNTRLQVEHAITELVVGVDLVKAQIRIAAGQSLPFRQDELRQRGHALECRIYAEDPANDFLPATGKLLHVVEPRGPGVRVDTGVVGGDEISRFYDPLIAKVAVLGEDRNDAIERMQRALRDYVLLGDVVTNIAFLRDLLSHPSFVRGEATTTLVDREFADWKPRTATPDLALIADALARCLKDGRSPHVSPAGDPHNPWRVHDAFRIGGD